MAKLLSIDLNFFKDSCKSLFEIYYRANNIKCSITTNGLKKKIERNARKCKPLHKNWLS